MSDDPLLYSANFQEVLVQIGKERSLQMLESMILVRYFEMMGERAYQMGKVYGFFHSYIGEEGIQTAAVYALGKENDWITSYRCHALAILLGMSVREGMCELYGKANGVAKGRGGSMHMYQKNMFGGEGIVGATWPIGAGLALNIKYRGINKRVSVCFGGDGAVMQGTFHETLNMATLWGLPLIVVIENNNFAMGTAVERGVANPPIGFNLSKAYGCKNYTVNGTNLCDCFALFLEVYHHVMKQGGPVLIEAIADRFRGHSISDSMSYRSKEELQKLMQKDPIQQFADRLKEVGWLDEKILEELRNCKKSEVKEAMRFAENSPSPDVSLLEKGVFVDEGD